MDKANQSLHGDHLQLAIIEANRPRVDGPASIHMRKFHLHGFRWRPVASLKFLPVRAELRVLRIDLDDCGSLESQNPILDDRCSLDSQNP